MIRIEPGAVNGQVEAPPSKSATHRAYLLASQATGPSFVGSPLRSADNDATLLCLHRLGARTETGEPGGRFQPSTCPTPAGTTT